MRLSASVVLADSAPASCDVYISSRQASRPVITACAITLGSFIYQFGEAATKFNIKNVFNIVGVLTRKRVKLRSQYGPFINTRHTLYPQTGLHSLLIRAQCRNRCAMSERRRCVVASPKTDNTSAMALIVTTKTTMSWSVKSTVSIMGRLQYCNAAQNTGVSLRKFGNRLCVPSDIEETFCVPARFKACGG